MRVVLGKSARRSLRKAPPQVVRKLQLWVKEVETVGLALTRVVPGWHDEPLQGRRRGQRSIRLNRQWRAVYVERDETLSVEILEVHAHDY